MAELSKQKKGDRFEDCARRVLQHIYTHLGITAFDWREPGKQWMKGKTGRFKCDVVGYKPSGQPVVFSAKFRSGAGAKNSDAGELLLSVTDLGAEGFLVVNRELQESAQSCVDEYMAGSIILGEGEDLDSWFAKVSGLIKTIFISTGERVAMHDECRIIVHDKSGKVIRDSATE